MGQSAAKKAFFPYFCKLFGSSRWDMLLLFLQMIWSIWIGQWPAPYNEGKGQKSGKPSPIFCTKLWVLFAPASIHIWQCIVCNQVCSPVVQKAPDYAWKVVLGRPRRPCQAPLVRPCERASPTKTSRSICNFRGNFTNPDSRLILGKVRRAQVDPTRPSVPVFPEK